MRQVHAAGERERRNMNRTTPEPTHDVVAVGHDGEDLFETECAWGEEDAERRKNSCNDYLNRQENPTSGDGTDLSHVSHYEVRER